MSHAAARHWRKLVFLLPWLVLCFLIGSAGVGAQEHKQPEQRKLLCFDQLDYAIGWKPYDTDAGVVRETEPSLVREGKGCMKMTFRISSEDVGKEQRIGIGRSDMRLSPPEGIGFWVRPDTGIPLRFSIRDEDGTAAEWVLKSLKPKQWNEVALEVRQAEIMRLPRASEQIDSPIVRMDFFITSVDADKAGKAVFYVDEMSGEWKDVPPVPVPRGPKAMDSVEDPTSLKVEHGKALSETREVFVREGKASLKVIWTIPEEAGQRPAWLNVSREEMYLPPPRGVSFWVYPESEIPLRFTMDDADDTRASWDLPRLRVGEWNLVRLEATTARKWIVPGREKTPQSNLDLDSPVLRAGFSVDASRLDRPGDYVWYVDDLQALYEAEVSLETVQPDCLPGLALDSREFSEGEQFLARSTFSAAQPGDVEVRFAMRPKSGGPPVLDLKRTFPVSRGVHTATLRIDANAVPVGSFVLYGQATGPNGQVLLDESKEAARLTPSQRVEGFEAAARPIEEKTQTLAQLLQRAEAAGVDCAYPRVSMATLRRFVPLALEFAGEGKFTRTELQLQYLSQLAEDAGKGVELLIAHPDRAPVVRRPDLGKLTMKDGDFRAGAEVVLLFGPLGRGMDREIESVPDFGFNCVDSWDSWANSISSVLKPSGEANTQGIEALKASREKLRELNLACTFSPGLNLPGWAFEKYPDTAGYGPFGPGVSRTWRHVIGPKLCGGGFWHFCMEAPTTRQLVAQYYQAIIPQIAQLPGARIFWLMNEPTYRSETPIYLDLLRQDLERKYADIARLNQTWNTAFGDFKDIPFPKRDNKAAWYDWMDFHHRQVTEWFRWLCSEIKRHDPEALVTNKPLCVSLLRPEHGISLEDQALILDIPGCDTSRSYQEGSEFPLGSVFGNSWEATSIMALDFFQSIAPNKPISDMEYHYAHSSVIELYPDDYVRASFWQSYLHGLRLNIFWLWAKTYRQGSDSTQHPPFARPNVAWTTGRTALDLRRLANYVALFPPKEREAAILYSRTSLFLSEREHARDLCRAYRALFFLDTPIAFTTERMIAQGTLRNKPGQPTWKLLIIPSVRYIPAPVYDEISAYARSGGVLAAMGDGIFEFDEHGKKRETASLRQCAGVHVIQTGPIRELSEELDALLTDAGVNRPVRVLDENGKNAWGVESRSVQQGGSYITYLINNTGENRGVQLSGTGAKHPKRELITSRRISPDRISLRPMEVMLLADERLQWRPDAASPHGGMFTIGPPEQPPAAD